MTKLKLGPIADDKPVKVTVELPAALHRDLIAYAAVLARETGQPGTDPVKLIVPIARTLHRHRSRLRQGPAQDQLTANIGDVVYPAVGLIAGSLYHHL